MNTVRIMKDGQTRVYTGISNAALIKMVFKYAGTNTEVDILDVAA
jgi:hypothetical protein